MNTAGAAFAVPAYFYMALEKAESYIIMCLAEFSGRAEP